MDAYRIRELIEFAEQRSRDYSLSNADIASFRDTAAALRELMQRSQPQGQAVDREADRARFSDAAFNAWLDTGISDAGHTVWDAVGDTRAAWAGWEARQFAGDAVLISECCGREECGGECGNEWRGMGMYRKPAACAGNMDGQRPVTPDMARDAERYRFLRGDHGPTSVRWPRWKIEHWTGFWNPVHGSELDAAIDAAMREASP